MKQLYSYFCLLLMISASTLVGQTNQYLHFDRVNDHVRLDGGSQYISNSAEFSMTGWFYTDQLAYGQGMIGFRGTNQGFYLIQLSDGTLECRLITDAGFHEYVGPNFTVLPGVWQHFAWVYDGATVALFVDGTLHGSVAASGQITETNIPFTIGRSILANLNFYFGGRADEVTVWDKALSATEIQDMMANELLGDEANLQLYYKFNQGAPCGDNTTITSLISMVGGGTRDADLVDFALSGGCTSNFDGVLQSGFQAISFDQIPNKLTTDGPFDAHASASSGLPVGFEIVSGPATIVDSTITLNGQAGEVVISAYQYGDMTWDTAAPITQVFTVVDPQQNTPNIDLRNPLEGIFRAPELGRIQLAAKVDIDFPELFEVGTVEFEVDGNIIPSTDWENGHYTAWWEPPAYGLYEVTSRAFNSYGAAAEEIASVIIVDTAVNTIETAFSGIWINSAKLFEEVEAELPSYLGAYDQITATLDVNCPPGGCGPWDRVAKVEVETHEGNWVEIIRYITSYGVECEHSIDVTDFMSALQGKIKFRMSCETFDNGFEYNLTLNYNAGTPTYKYSQITPVWHQTFDFGNPGNLQPVDSQIVEFPDNTLESKFKLIATGHGWGNNNTSNAAEFFETTHHIWVDGSETFEHHNWLTCNPNPDACQPQNGTWYFDRAGFCPGAISPWFDYDLTSYIANGEAMLDYVFDQDYQDDCHVNNPFCVSGLTCPDCNDGFNPHLIVASSVINFSDDPFFVSVDEDIVQEPLFRLYPNPSTGQVRLELSHPLPNVNIKIMNPLGMEVRAIPQASFVDGSLEVNLSDLSKGMYMVVLETSKGVDSEVLILK